MSENQDILEEYFQRYGWTVKRDGDTSLITAFQGENGNFLMTVQITEYWIYLTVEDFIVVPESFRLSPLMERLFLLNYNVEMVKFIINEKGSVVICIELPPYLLSYELFEASIDMLSFAADAYQDELLELVAENGEQGYTEGDQTVE